MFIKKKASTMKQMAYARRLLGAQGDSKKSIALDVGYSPNVANSISTHIESKPGFNNAMAALAIDSNNLALAAMHEFKARGFKEFSNKDLIGALNAIGSAWSRFNAVPKEKTPSQAGNKLRTVILQQIENQTLTTNSNTVVKPPVEGELVKEELDF
jgi:hypothetical protein